MSFRSDLYTFYSDESRDGRRHTAVQNFNVGMLGTNDDPAMNLHAAETCGVLRFAHAVLVPRYGAFLGDNHIHFKRAVSSCIVMLDIIREFDVLPTNPAIQRLCDNTVVHLRALEALQIQCRPKHHTMLEMAAKFPLRANHQADNTLMSHECASTCVLS